MKVLIEVEKDFDILEPEEFVALIKIYLEYVWGKHFILTLEENSKCQ